MKTPEPWTYKSVTVFPADRNTSGIRWTANAGVGAQLRSDTKAGMRELISEAVTNQRRAS